MLLVSSLGVSGLGGLLSNVYYSRGNAGTPVRIQLVAGAVFATGVIPLVYYYGLLGAAVSYGAASLVSTLWFAYALRKQGLLNVSRHFAAKGGALYLLTFAASYTPAYLLSYRLALLPVYTLLGAGVALAGLKYLGMVSEADAKVAGTVFSGKLGKIAAALIHAVSAS
jgi:peptidoglycan biosynthesis protein MviN/MurJ (putative lipid II flippase)